MDLRRSSTLRPARPSGTAFVAAALACLAAGCTGLSGPEQAYKSLTRVDYGKPYIGMSKDEVLRCAGSPRSRIPGNGGTETLIYHYKGAGPVPGGTPKDPTCTASLTISAGRVTRVNYAHMQARSPYAYQSEKNPEKAEELRRTEAPTCVFSLPRCPR